MEVVTRDGLEGALDELRAQVVDPREGILGPRSVAWALGGEIGIFLGGGRAALLQLAHPMVAHAVDQHSETRRDVAGRFHRTFVNVFAMVFGDLDASFRAARRVHAVHAQIHGTMAAVGGWPAGAPYHANDADALRWVHATLVDTTLASHELLYGPLAPLRADAYVTEMNRFARLFGIPHDRLPRSRGDHDDYMRTMLASDRIAVAPCAREMAAFLVGRAAASQPPLGRIGEAITQALLPPPLAAAFGLRATPRRTRAGLASFGALYRRLPRAVIELPAATAARHRLGGAPPTAIARWTERQLGSLARRTSGR